MSLNLYSPFRNPTAGFTVQSSTFSANTTNNNLEDLWYGNFRDGIYKVDFPWEMNWDGAQVNQIYFSTKNLIHTVPLIYAEEQSGAGFYGANKYAPGKKYLSLDINDVLYNPSDSRDYENVYSLGLYTEISGVAPNRVLNVRHEFAKDSYSTLGGAPQYPSGITFESRPYAGIATDTRKIAGAPSLKTELLVRIPWNIQFGLTQGQYLNALRFRSPNETDNNIVELIELLDDNGVEPVRNTSIDGLTRTRKQFNFGNPSGTGDYTQDYLGIKLEGTAPNRIFTVVYTVEQYGSLYDFQFVFYENDKAIIDVTTGEVYPSGNSLVTYGFEGFDPSNPPTTLTYLNGILDGPDFSYKTTRLKQDPYSSPTVYKWETEIYENDKNSILIKFDDMGTTTSTNTNLLVNRTVLYNFNNVSQSAYKLTFTSQGELLKGTNRLYYRATNFLPIMNPSVIWNEIRQVLVYTNSGWQLVYKRNPTQQFFAIGYSRSQLLITPFFSERAGEQWCYSGGLYNSVQTALQGRNVYNNDPYDFGTNLDYAQGDYGTSQQDIDKGCYFDLDGFGSQREEEFVVPVGITSITVDLWGGGGGGGTAFRDSNPTHLATYPDFGEVYGGDGGGGGYVRAVIDVTPGETLKIRVGGGGNVNYANRDKLDNCRYVFDSEYSYDQDIGGPSWSYYEDQTNGKIYDKTTYFFRSRYENGNNLTTGVNHDFYQSFFGSSGGSGGGYSGIFRGSTPLVIAGGGGGGGGTQGLYQNSACCGGNGGAGGGTQGQSGSSGITIVKANNIALGLDSVVYSGTGNAAQGGTQSAGGAGGNSFGNIGGCSTADGEDGQAYKGGRGKNFAPYNALYIEHGSSGNPGVNGGGSGGGGCRANASPLCNPNDGLVSDPPTYAWSVRTSAVSDSTAGGGWFNSQPFWVESAGKWFMQAEKKDTTKSFWYSTDGLTWQSKYVETTVDNQENRRIIYDRIGGRLIYAQDNINQRDPNYHANKWQSGGFAAGEFPIEDAQEFQDHGVDFHHSTDGIVWENADVFVNIGEQLYQLPRWFSSDYNQAGVLLWGGIPLWITSGNNSASRFDGIQYFGEGAIKVDNTNPSPILGNYMILKHLTWSQSLDGGNPQGSNVYEQYTALTVGWNDSVGGIFVYANWGSQDPSSTPWLGIRGERLDSFYFTYTGLGPDGDDYELFLYDSETTGYYKTQYLDEPTQYPLSKTTIPSSYTTQKLCYSNDIYMLSGRHVYNDANNLINNNHLSTSTDGLSWTIRTTGLGRFGAIYTTFDSTTQRILGVSEGAPNISVSPRIVASTDAIHWSLYPLPGINNSGKKYGGPTSFGFGEEFSSMEGVYVVHGSECDSTTLFGDGSPTPDNVLQYGNEFPAGNNYYRHIVRGECTNLEDVTQPQFLPYIAVNGTTLGAFTGGGGGGGYYGGGGGGLGYWSSLVGGSIGGGGGGGGSNYVGGASFVYANERGSGRLPGGMDAQFFIDGDSPSSPFTLQISNKYRQFGIGSGGKGGQASTNEDGEDTFPYVTSFGSRGENGFINISWII